MQASPQIVDDPPVLRTAHRFLSPALFALLFAPSALPQPVAAPEDDPRVVRFFDFEDAEAAPVTFPASFLNLADRYGLGRFGRIELDRTHAATGRWSLRFEPDGISLIAGTPTGLIPVIPHADYAISVRVRSERLVRGGARLTGALHDARGNIIPGSTRSSEIIRPGPQWTLLSVTIPGDSIDAANLTLELEVLQPDRLPRQRSEAHRPLPADVGAAVWFDALTVRFEPRIRLHALQELPVFREGDPPAFRAAIRDFAGEALHARVHVTDLSNALVHDAALHTPRGGRPIDLTLPAFPPGWYMLTLEVRGSHGPVATRTIAFAVTPARRRAGGGHRTAPRFILMHPWRADEPLAGLASRVRSVAPDEVLIEIWHASMEDVDDPARTDALRREVEQLTAMDVEAGFILGGLPRDLAQSAGLDPDNVLGLLAAPGQRGLSALNSLLADSTLRTRRWQVGLRPDPTQRYGIPSDAHTRGLTALVRAIHPNPDVRVTRLPFPEPAADAAESSVNEVIFLPQSVAADDVAEVLAGRDAAAQRSKSILLEAPDRERFSPFDRIIDLALRTIHAWTTHPAELAITSPWQRDGAHDVMHADPVLPLWRGLTDILGGRRFVGRMPAPEGVHLLMAEGDGPDDHALIVYADHTFGEPISGALPIPGATSNATAHDVLGRRVPTEHRDGTTFITPGNLPVAIEGIDLRPGLFMAQLVLDPPVVPWSQRVSEHELVIRNPWPGPITGTISFAQGRGIEVLPNRITVSAPGGGTMRVPVELRVARGAVSGVHAMSAAVHLDADRLHVFDTPVMVETGWPHIDVTASWQLIANEQTGGRDLLIRMRITNQSDQTAQLEAYLYPPQRAIERRLIGRLEPAASAVRVFRIVDGARSMSGLNILCSVQELGGPGQVNRLVAIPRFSESPMASVEAGR